MKRFWNILQSGPWGVTDEAEDDLTASEAFEARILLYSLRDEGMSYDVVMLTWQAVDLELMRFQTSQDPNIC